MTIIEEFEAIAKKIPSTKPKLTNLASGVVMMDIQINGILYCVEFFPDKKVYGLSKMTDSTPFWEGVEEVYTSATSLEMRLIQLNQTGTDKPSPPTDNNPLDDEGK